MWGRVGAWCLSWWQRDPVGTAWSKQVAPGRGQAQGPLIHSTPPLVPTGPWAASTSMDMIPRFGRQNSLGLDLSVDEELSRSFEPCLNDHNRYCHAERSEASLCPSRETLRGVYTERSACAQGDKLLPVLVGKIIIGDAGIHGPPTTWPE